MTFQRRVVTLAEVELLAVLDGVEHPPALSLWTLAAAAVVAAAAVAAVVAVSAAVAASATAAARRPASAPRGPGDEDDALDRSNDRRG